MKHKFFITVFALLFFVGMVNAQVPASGAVDVAITTDYVIPNNTGLADGNYDVLVISNGAIYERINVPAFVGLNGATVNATTDLVNYSDYSWEFVLFGGAIGAGLYGPFTFTTVGPTITLTGGAVSITEDGVITDLTATADAAIGKNLVISVIYSSATATVINASDFTNSAGTYPTETITIAGGSLTNTTTITSVADNNLEGDEVLTATIVPSSSYVVGGSAQDVTITDNETVDISVSTSPIAENAGTVNFVATVNSGGLVENGVGTIPITWGGTALGSEYTNAGDITIIDGFNAGFITITSTDDAIWEDDETITATVTNVYPYTGGTVGTVTVTDDEGLQAPLNTVTGVSTLPKFQWDEGQGNPTTYTLNIGTVSGTYTNTITVVDGGAYNGFTVPSGIVTFYANETDAYFPLANSDWFYWQINDNGNLSEEFSFMTTEGFTLSLSNPSSGVAVYQYDPILFSWYISQSTGNLKYYLQVYEKLSAP
ncbi:MAG: hypothetical protein ABIJ97_03965, partial [Bacteroidota bacterium]